MKTFVEQKGEGPVLRLDKKFHLDHKNLDSKARSGRPKTRF